MAPLVTVLDGKMAQDGSSAISMIITIGLARFCNSVADITRQL